MSIGIWQLILILVIVFVIFGAGKLPNVMGDVGKGMRSLKEGLKGEEDKEEAVKATTSKRVASSTKKKSASGSKSRKKKKAA